MKTSFLLSLLLVPSEATSRGLLRHGASTDAVVEDIVDHRHLLTADFAVDLAKAVCPGLVEIGKEQAPDMDTCAALCASDANCDLWQYCTGSCLLHDGVTYTPGAAARCYISNDKSPREVCARDPQKRWIGAARTGSGRAPMRIAPVTTKRGFSGYLEVIDADGVEHPPQCGDAEALGLEDSWYYTWMRAASRGLHCSQKENLWPSGPNPSAGGTKMGGEFVPMLIGLGAADSFFASQELLTEEWTRGNAHFLLGYNEPDPAPNHPHSCLPSEAAADWVKVQKVAASFDPPLTLVSPVPASNNWDDDGRSPWLDEFFGNCTQIQECDPSLIKYIAFHDYVGDAALLKRKLDGIKKYYGRDIWVTEYAIGRWTPSPLRDEQEAYMKETLPILEEHPAVFRYVWFNSRIVESRWGGVKDLLVENVPEPTITSTGIIYRDWPKGASTVTPPVEPPIEDEPAIDPTPDLPAELGNVVDADGPIKYEVAIQYENEPKQVNILVKERFSTLQMFVMARNQYDTEFGLLASEVDFVPGRRYQAIVSDKSTLPLNDGDKTSYLEVRAKKNGQVIWSKTLCSDYKNMFYNVEFEIPNLA